MKAVIQRVLSASVTVDGEVVSSIGKGMLVFAAVSHNDTVGDANCLIRKLLSLKMWPTPKDKPWGSSIKDIEGEILLVSQFTLFANINKGSKPDFHAAAPPDVARSLYSKLVELTRQAYTPERVKDGVFGAMMDVALVNDGPVTFEFDTSNSGSVTEEKAKEAKRKKWEERKAASKEGQTGATQPGTAMEPGIQDGAPPTENSGKSEN
ncbi:D-Tyr tRNAtyr deacylase-like domain-containing protein [Kalaharituber pfeilii]|nr:D-Tyr tRNAtyr deacylase-like domain-containing protein [Kalaharituber pfeilii]